MFLAVKDAILDILESLVGTDQPFQEVFGYSEPTPQAFPCAMIRGVSGGEAAFDSASNLMTANFVIRVLQRVENSESAEDQRLALIDYLCEVFRKKEIVDTLGGIVEQFTISSISFIETNEEQPVFGFDFVVSASKIKLIN